MDLSKFTSFIERTKALDKKATVVAHGAGTDLSMLLPNVEKVHNEEGKILHKAFPDLKIKKKPSVWDDLKKRFQK